MSQDPMEFEEKSDEQNASTSNTMEVDSQQQQEVYLISLKTKFGV
jgi:hypothetical protein